MATKKVLLDRGNINQFASLLKDIGLGSILTPIKEAPAAFTASATYTLANPTGALFIESVRVLASGTAGSVGVYQVADAAATLLIPPGGANAAVGVCRISDDRKTLTFPNTVTQIIVQYIPMPAADLSVNVGDL